MTQYTEEDLIAYQLGEPCDRAGIGRALESDPELAAMLEQIARTLRVFSGERVPEPDVAQAWARLRATLPPPAETPGRRFGGEMSGTWWVKGPAFALLLLVVVMGAMGVVRWRAAESARREVARSGARTGERSGALFGERSGSRPRLTPTPAGEADDLPMAEHLDRAERWLTEVSHTAQPLDAAARAQAQGLLAENAVYVRSARERGDLPDAAVLERLGRVLTAVSHDPPAEGAGWHLRLEMNTDGLLFEIRVLRQNQVQGRGDGQ